MFDPVTMPLRGLGLIAASAGTGITRARQSVTLMSDEQRLRDVVDRAV